MAHRHRSRRRPRGHLPSDQKRLGQVSILLVHASAPKFCRPVSVQGASERKPTEAGLLLSIVANLTLIEPTCFADCELMRNPEQLVVAFQRSQQPIDSEFGRLGRGNLRVALP